MSLKENTLFGVKDKVQIAIKRIQEFEPEEGYHLAFSGGKDSQVIYELTKMSEVKFDAHFNLTTVDPPELVYFIRNNYPDVTIKKPEISMWNLILEKKFLPTRKIRYCCEYLKEGRAQKNNKNEYDRILITGIRSEESSKRSKRKLFENCFKHKLQRYLNPIIDWLESDVWEFIKLKKLEYCKLYDEGYKRIGCIMCPMAGKKGMIRDKNRFPKYYLKYLKTMDRLIKIREKNGMDNLNKNSKDLMHWWIYGKEHKGNPDQTVIFE